MICPACGTEVDGSRWFCSSCRAPLHADEEIMPPEEGCARANDGKAPGERAPGTAELEHTPEGRAGFLFRGRLRKSWVIRILLTALIIAILIAALLLISRSRKAGGAEQVRRYRYVTASKELNDARGAPAGFHADLQDVRERARGPREDMRQVRLDTEAR